MYRADSRRGVRRRISQRFGEGAQASCRGGDVLRREQRRHDGHAVKAAAAQLGHVLLRDAADGDNGDVDRVRDGSVHRVRDRAGVTLRARDEGRARAEIVGPRGLRGDGLLDVVRRDTDDLIRPEQCAGAGTGASYSSTTNPLRGRLSTSPSAAKI